ncbi:hypothetical protein F4679DRAFT_532051 [Xylaria curta]|nr:hypothetical protein F4679DRAFT_532051 [Xylaria curta]
MNSTQPPLQSPLIRAPEDIRLLIYSRLPNHDIKNLRLVSSFFGHTACPRLARVFISANPRNIEVFEAISQHDRYRAQVKEIVWDEASFVSGPESEECPRWYGQACKNSRYSEPDILYTLEAPQQIASQLSNEESWAYYRSLLRQQQEVLDSRAHIRALESAIGRFPALRKITITDAAHGRYETPMVRAFPYGFKRVLSYCREYFAYQPLTSNETGKGWNGFRAIMHLLAQNLGSGKVTELDIRASEGLNIDLFEKPCQTLTDFQTVLWRANFESLHLDLTSRGRYPFGRVLDGAADGQDLKRLTLHADAPKFSLRTIFNPNSLLRLEHFNLTHFGVEEQDLLAVLAMLPRIRTIELNWLHIDNGSHDSLLRQIKDTLGWQDRILKPRLSFVLNAPGFAGILDRAIWVEEEVHEFLYESGVNPFDDDYLGGVGIMINAETVRFGS